MAGVKILGFTVIRSQTERDIQKAFEDFAKKLNEQKTKMTDDIVEWTNAVMQSIYKHANRQKHLVEQEYVTQIQNLNKMSEEFIGELRVYEEKKDIKRINQLLEQCAHLKFELNALETYGQSIPFIKVSGKRKSSVMDEDGFSVAEIERSEFDNNSTEKLDEVLENSMNISSKSFTASGFTNINQANQQSFTRITSNDDNRSTICCLNAPQECPTCFMAFPSNMTLDDRMAHINEHATND